MNKRIQKQLMGLLYEKKSEVYAMSDDPKDEFDCLVGLIEDGTIGSFAELAEYGVEE
jgi:hypothetical protein